MHWQTQYTIKREQKHFLLLLALGCLLQSFQCEFDAIHAGSGEEFNSEWDAI